MVQIFLVSCHAALPTEIKLFNTTDRLLIVAVLAPATQIQSCPKAGIFDQNSYNWKHMWAGVD